MKLQKYRGKGKQAKNLFYRIQPYLPNGVRATFRFGTGEKQATKAAQSIYELIDCAKAGVEPSAQTKHWLAETACEKMSAQLLEHGLIDAMPIRFSGNGVVTISALADEYIRVRGANTKEETKVIWRKAKTNLIECYSDVDVTTLSISDGRDFLRWLVEEKKLSENTAKQRLRYARSFLEFAIEDELIAKNPFKAKGQSVSQTAAKKAYVEWDKIDSIIECCPTNEWKLLFALTRSIPLRIPSEICHATWSDVDWDRNAILIHSEKTAHLGKHGRMVPILDTFRNYLDRQYDAAPDGSTHIFSTLHSHTNLATTAKKYVTKAKIAVWSNFFNTIRASAETDLMDEFGLRRACQWAGNSAVTAMKNYALVKNEDFGDFGSNETTPKTTPILKCDANSDAVCDGQAMTSNV